MHSLRRPAISAIKGSRLVASQAAPKAIDQPKFNPTPQDAKVTRLPNGVLVVSHENYSALSRVAVLFNAGARHEPADNLGITHCIRAASNNSTQRSTAFMLAKQMQQIGGNLTCTTTREHVAYSVNCLRSDLSQSVALLGQAATSPVFKPWELESVSRRLKLDLELYQHSPEAQLVELLHRAAYRDTLGQSLFMQPDCVGSFSPSTLEAFVGAHHVTGGAVVAGLGVDHEQLVMMARKMPFHQGDAAQTKKAKYHGGETRVQMKGPLVHAALVTEGVAVGSTADVLAISLLQLSLGVGPFVKYGSTVATSKIGKAAQAAASGPLAASCLNINYSDSGLFGFKVVAGAKDARKVLSAIVSTMAQATKGSISDADLQKAKRQLKAIAHMESESSECVFESVGTQALLTGKVDLSASALDAAIDKVTAEDVNKIAKKVINGKPTFAVVGNLSHTPYLDELMTRA
jgi:ubiquinol-cytochrome c reductase core subunit 2